MTNPTDFTGEEICSGDLVAYPVRRGSDMQLKTARITSWMCGGNKYTLSAINDDGRRVTLRSTNRLIILEKGNA